jgi:hypothetical protein
MPRNYKSKGLRSQWSLENLQKAVNDVLMYNKSEKSAAATFGVPRQTLRRHLKKAKNGLGVEKTIGRPRILHLHENHPTSAPEVNCLMPSDQDLREDQPTSAPEVNNLISSDQDSAENRTILAANDLGQHENISQDRADTDKSQKISEAYSFKQIIAETVTKRETEQQTRKRRRCSMQQL